MVRNCWEWRNILLEVEVYSNALQEEEISTIINLGFAKQYKKLFKGLYFPSTCRKRNICAYWWQWKKGRIMEKEEKET